MTDTEYTNFKSILQSFTNHELRQTVAESVASWATQNNIAPYKLTTAFTAVLRQFRTDLTDVNQVLALLRTAQTLRWQDVAGLDGLADEVDLTAEQRGTLIGAVLGGIMARIAAKVTALQALTTPDLAALLAEQAAHDEAELAAMNPAEEEVGE